MLLIGFEHTSFRFQIQLQSPCQWVIILLKAFLIGLPCKVMLHRQFCHRKYISNLWMLMYDTKYFFCNIKKSHKNIRIIAGWKNMILIGNMKMKRGKNKELWKWGILCRLPENAIYILSNPIEANINLMCITKGL